MFTLYHYGLPRKTRGKRTQCSNSGSEDIICWSSQMGIVLRNEVTFTLNPPVTASSIFFPFLSLAIITLSCSVDVSYFAVSWRSFLLFFRFVVTLVFTGFFSLSSNFFLHAFPFFPFFVFYLTPKPTYCRMDPHRFS
jgi:hypothetical protein